MQKGCWYADADHIVCTMVKPLDLPKKARLCTYIFNFHFNDDISFKTTFFISIYFLYLKKMYFFLSLPNQFALFCLVLLKICKIEVYLYYFESHIDIIGLCYSVAILWEIYLRRHDKCHVRWHNLHFKQMINTGLG